MRFLPTRVHGILDYIVGIAFIVPWMFGFEGVPALILSLLGITTIVFSSLTNYELGFAKILSMKAHLVLDFLSGAFLAASPWLFDITGTIRTVFVALGLFEMVASLVTKLQPAGRPDYAEAEYSRQQKGANSR